MFCWCSDVHFLVVVVKTEFVYFVDKKKQSKLHNMFMEHFVPSPVCTYQLCIQSTHGSVLYDVIGLGHWFISNFISFLISYIVIYYRFGPNIINDFNYNSTLEPEISPLEP